MWQEKLKVYDALVAKCNHFERKGKTMLYTSVNGYMFSLYNKTGEIGIRFSKEVQESISKNLILAYKIVCSYNERLCSYTRDYA